MIKAAGIDEDLFRFQGPARVVESQEQLELLVEPEVLAERRAKMDASEWPWQPTDRQGLVSALRAYARLTTDAATGGARPGK